MTARRVLLIVGGGIAAYKSLELVRLLAKSGVATTAILTHAGAEFVTPLSLAALTGEKVYQDLFSLTDESEMGHIELSRSADLIVVAPATADLMARAAQGLAGDLATTTLLATDTPVLMAPAMNLRMWLHPATQRNFAALKGDGVAFIARTTHPAYTATQFALFTSLAAVPRTFINASAGWLVEHLGWVDFFWLCFVLAIPGMLLLTKVAPWNETHDKAMAQNP